MVRLETVLNSWKDIREATAEAVEDFPAGELDFKPTPEMDSFRTIATHILQAGNALTGILLEGSDFSRKNLKEKGGKYIVKLPDGVDGATLAGMLRKSVEAQTSALAQRDADFYAGLVNRFDGQMVTRLEMLQFVKEHELTHRQQLFMCLRMKGIVPGTTRRRMAQQAQQAQ